MAGTTRTRAAGAATNGHEAGALGASWFEVDRNGLAQLLAGRGPERTILELVQNAWDQNVTHVVIRLEEVDGGHAWVYVEDDDPDGWADLSHAFTLFAPSVKKQDAEKRGRFNLGEKLVLAICDKAEIETTRGGVRFGPDGRSSFQTRRAGGSSFEAAMRLTSAEVRAALAALRQLIPPAGIATIVNGEPIATRTQAASFGCRLLTEIADDAGVLRRLTRATRVTLYEPLAGEEPHVYEMGIPVMPLAGRWHADVGQRIPLTLERNALPDRFVTQLRQEIVDHCHELLSGEDAKAPWVSSVLDRVEPAALTAVIRERYGDRAVIADPTDPEATKRAVAHGYTVVHGGSLPRGAWETVRQNNIIEPAGRLLPSPKVIASAEGAPALQRADWTPGMTLVEAYARRLAHELLGHGVTVSFHNAAEQAWLAAYGREDASLSFNYGRLGHRWFNEPDQRSVDALLLHEFAHDTCSDHLSEQFHEAICQLGARLRYVQFRVKSDRGAAQ